MSALNERIVKIVLIQCFYIFTLATFDFGLFSSVFHGYYFVFSFQEQSPILVTSLIRFAQWSSTRTEYNNA